MHKMLSQERHNNAADPISMTFETFC